MKKSIITIAILAITLGFSSNANAQILDFLNKAVETVNKANETYNNARDAYNNTVNTYSNSNSQNNNQPSYRTLTSVNMIAWSSVGTYGQSTVRKSATIIMDEYDEKMVKCGSSTYSIYENGSYDSYSRDASDPSYYKYYTYIDSKKYYFNM